MTTISSRVIQYKTPGGKYEDFKRVVTYSTSLKCFIVKIPDVWQQYLHREDLRAQTEEGLDKAWEEARKKVDEMSKSKRKVICYRFSCYAMEKVYNEKMEHTGNTFIKDTANRGSFGGGPELRLDFYVCNEVKSTLEKEPTYLFLNGNYFNSFHSGSNYKVMDWTPEREAFFIQFEQELINLIKKVTSFLDQEPNVVTALIERCKTFNALPEIIGNSPVPNKKVNNVE